MPNPSPPWLERAAGSTALLLMLVLLALTIGSPACRARPDHHHPDSRTGHGLHTAATPHLAGLGQSHADCTPSRSDRPKPERQDHIAEARTYLAAQGITFENGDWTEAGALTATASPPTA